MYICLELEKTDKFILKTKKLGHKKTNTKKRNINELKFT